MNQFTSPYKNIDVDQFGNITKQLVADFPLNLEELKALSFEAWKLLWNTNLGNSSDGISLSSLNLPTPVVGYFFEKILARLLNQNYPDIWVGGEGNQKDIHHKPNDYYSFEIKTSGQLGHKIFGNRSYGQETETEKKKKLGYYLTLNFYNKEITLLRFGWIDFDDWRPQKSASGQAATLKEEVYKYKLISIKGTYVLNAPLEILSGIGETAKNELNKNGFITVSDLLKIDKSDKFYKYSKLAKIYKSQFSD